MMPPKKLYLVEFRDKNRPRLWLHKESLDITESPFDVIERQAYYEKVGFETRRSVYQLVSMEQFPAKVAKKLRAATPKEEIDAVKMFSGENYRLPDAGERYCEDQATPQSDAPPSAETFWNSDKIFSERWNLLARGKSANETTWAMMEAYAALRTAQLQSASNDWESRYWKEFKRSTEAEAQLATLREETLEQCAKIADRHGWHDVGDEIRSLAQPQTVTKEEEKA